MWSERDKPRKRIEDFSITIAKITKTQKDHTLTKPQKT